MFGVFSPTISMENLTQRWPQSGPFFAKSGQFLRFLKKRRGGFHPLSCAPATNELSRKTFWMHVLVKFKGSIKGFVKILNPLYCNTLTNIFTCRTFFSHFVFDKKLLHRNNVGFFSRFSDTEAYSKQCQSSNGSLKNRKLYSKHRSDV